MVLGRLARRVCGRFCPHRPLLADVLASERGVEYAYVVSEVGINGSLRILDVGCWGTLLPDLLASLGHTVECYDLRDWSLGCAVFRRGDARRASGPYDAILLISVLEHVGVLYRSPDEVDYTEQASLLAELADKLTPHGKIIVTVPVAARDALILRRRQKWEKHVKRRVFAWARVFSPRSLIELARSAGLRVHRIRYYARTENGCWTPTHTVHNITVEDRAVEPRIPAIACTTLIPS